VAAGANDVLGPLARPAGPALTYKSSDFVTIDMIRHDDHTVAVAHGVAPLMIRRGLADLESA